LHGGTLADLPNLPFHLLRKVSKRFREFPQGLPNASQSFQKFHYSSPENHGLPMTYQRIARPFRPPSPQPKPPGIRPRIRFGLADRMSAVVRRLRGLSSSMVRLVRHRMADLWIVYFGTDSIRREAFVRSLFLLG
jgi:hypothetical protein